MATKLSEVIRTAYSNSINGYDIKYNVTQNNGEQASIITGDISKGNVRSGNIYMKSDSSVSINFENNVTNTDKEAIFNVCMQDMESIFKDLNKQQ